MFYQTVSLKSVGNLTDFVREHMLEAPAVDERIATLCRELEDLNQAHQSVVRARRQVEMLTPLVEACDQLDLLAQSTRGLEDNRRALHPYCEAQKAALLTSRIARREDESARLDDRLRLARERLSGLLDQRRDVERAIEDQGGRRLTDIERTRRQEHAKRYQELCRALTLEPACEEDRFHRTRQQAELQRARVESEQTALDQRNVQHAISRESLKRDHGEIAAELQSLRARKTNLEARMLAIRARVCEALDIAESELPFAGELLQVRADEQRWEGAIERVLHGLAQSMLVREADYASVAAFVDGTDLKGRLVYFRVADNARMPSERPGPDSLVRKLEIKPEGHTAIWLERELIQRFDYACCEDLESFKRRPKALSANGQVKSGGDKHEKDDRRRLDDRSRYVLGWSNSEKIRVLEEREASLHEAMLKLLVSMQSIEHDKKQLGGERDRLLELLRFERYTDLAWQPVAAQIEALLDEKRRLEQSSDTLRELRAGLAKIGSDIAGAEAELERRREERATLGAKIEADRALLAAALQAGTEVAADTRESLFAALTAMLPEALGNREFTIEGCAAREHEMREFLQARIDAEVKRAGRLREDIVARMGAFKTTFPLEARDTDAKPEAAAEYRSLLDKLVGEDLPRHEQRFKRMLNEGTINDVALLRSQLDSERDAIVRKLAKINESLAAIEYHEGTYITLVNEHNPDQEIRQFQQDLRACLGDTLAASDDALYTEEKFQRVKALVDRFVGREGLTELDRRWTRKVADVRNWFLFSASERWQSDGKEREHYTDSAGKSGGQKEKLAYTILASKAAHQDHRARSLDHAD